MIVITGASDGLGLEVAKLYQAAGKTVVNISRRESSCADINICVSLSDEEGVDEAAKQILEVDEPLEALINCAGVLSIQPLAEVSEAEFDRLMNINVKAAILLVARLSGRIEKDKTDILNVASTVGLKGYAEQAVYGASKWAMRGFSVHLQTEFKGKPNRIISFCPGGFKTRLFEKATGINDIEGESWMQPADVAIVLKQTLDLPKNMEVSEIVINRK